MCVCRLTTNFGCFLQASSTLILRQKLLMHLNLIGLAKLADLLGFKEVFLNNGEMIFSLLRGHLVMYGNIFIMKMALKSY